MKLSSSTKLALVGVAALAALAYAKSKNRCPNGGVWKATATGGYCAQASVCPDCVQDAGTQSLGGVLGDVGDYAKGIAGQLGATLGNLFGSSSSPPGGDGPITSPEQLS